MRSSFLLTIALLGAALLTMGLQCDKDEYFEPPKQAFKEKITVTPVQKQYRVGDTIWVRFATSDKSLYDTISQQRLPSEKVRFLFGASLIPIHDTPVDPPGGFGDFILPAGTTTTTPRLSYGQSAYWYLGCDNTVRYDAIIGIKLKHTGIYLLQASSVINEIEQCPGQNNPYPGSYVWFTFDVPDTNKDVYLTLPASKRTDPAYERILDTKAAYALQVQ